MWVSDLVHSTEILLNGVTDSMNFQLTDSLHSHLHYQTLCKLKRVSVTTCQLRSSYDCVLVYTCISSSWHRWAIWSLASVAASNSPNILCN
jgi:hypothetical protein